MSKETDSFLEGPIKEHSPVDTLMLINLETHVRLLAYRTVR